MTTRYRLDLAYDGTAYHGWQTQAAGIATVQHTLETAFARLVGYPVHVHGCGRTDAGVHAEGYVAHVDLRVAPSGALLHKLQWSLPRDIHIGALAPAPPNFDAQRSAVARSYRYRIGLVRDPFSRAYVGDYSALALDVTRMRATAGLYARQRDFRGFCRSPEQYPTTVCALEACTLSQNAAGTELHFEVTADRFLHNMVRLLVARMLDVGRGALEVGDLERAFATGQPPRFLHAAHAQGLSLVHVRYV